MAAPRHQAGAILVDAGRRDEAISGLDPQVRAIGASSAGMNQQDIVAETPERECRPIGVLLL
jgi:hypothetical protein